MKIEDIIDEDSARQIMRDGAREILRINNLIKAAEKYIIDLYPYKVGQIVEVQDYNTVVKCWISHLSVHREINGTPKMVLFRCAKLKKDGTKSNQLQKFVDKGEIIRAID